MGNVTSKQEDASPLFIKDQSRLAITNIRITNARNRTLYTVIPDSQPASRYTVKKENDDDSIVEYVQDPDSSPTNSPNFLLRLTNDEDIFLYFNFIIGKNPVVPSVSADQPSSGPVVTTINSLTFLTASTAKDLESLVVREFNANPNIHRHPNVDLVGDYSTTENATEQFEWGWRWRPPKTTEDRGGGWRNQCSFAEYNQRGHRLDTLVTFSFWVQNTQRTMQSPRLLSPTLQVPPRLRVPSNMSFDSRVSDSDPEGKDIRELSSPIEAIPENGLGLELPPQKSQIKVDLNCRPGEDLSTQDDGPLFRATMKALEQKTGNMRTRMKKVLKKAEAAREAQIMSNQSVAAFMEALREASSSNANAVQPALDHYFENIAREILSYQEQNAKNLQLLIIDPLSKLYSNDIKQAEGKKKDFEDESRDYYAYVGRYLGQRQDSLKEKKRVEADTKYQTKRRTYELKRFDYSSFMQDLHGGRKDQEVLSQLTRYAETQAKGYLATAKKIESMLPQLEALCREVKETDKEYQLQRTGREEKRRTLEKPLKVFNTPEPQSTYFKSPILNKDNRFSTTLDVDVLGADYPQSSIGDNDAARSGPDFARSTSPNAPHGASKISPTHNKFKGIRDLEEKDQPSSGSLGIESIQQHKEGLLWSLSRPGSHLDPRGLNKQAWHKFWIVLDQGKLSEYINWKHTLEPHMDPIDLRMASVREARSADRRFCFEVITPNFTRVYQATGEDDMKSWIQSINSALQGAFEGKSPPQDINVTKQSESIGRNIFGKSSSNSNRVASYSQSPKSSGRYGSIEERPLAMRSRSADDKSVKLLQMIRDADAGNRCCADCNSESKVEWVSINLGIIVCIECSGIHRSLGTHISKVRSLTLDTVSFTQDLTELLLRVGNRISNMIFEANLDQTTKPPPQATRDQRHRFITAKYAERTYVQPFSSQTSRHATPEECLLASIKTGDLQNVLYALAAGANTNAVDRSRSTAAIFLALAAADPAAPGGMRQTSSQAAADAASSRPSFPTAELLLQNGADIPPGPAPIPLSRAAQIYLESKLSQRLGKASAGVVYNATPPLTGSGDRISAMPSQNSLGGKLIKRNPSAGQASVRLVSRGAANP